MTDNYNEKEACLGYQSGDCPVCPYNGDCVGQADFTAAYTYGTNYEYLSLHQLYQERPTRIKKLFAEKNKK